MSTKSKAAAVGFAIMVCLGISASAHAAQQRAASTRYLMFQIFTYGGNSQGALPPAADIKGTVHDIVSAIGGTGGDRDKLGFTVRPLTLDQSDDQIRRLITESFTIARNSDAAVAFHIDDSMLWPRGSSLDKPANIEWLDWNGTPNTGRRLDWSATPISTYPEAGTFELIHREVAAHASPAWISAEGTNVVPSGMPGEPTMETYLAKMYDHGAVLVNIFSWGISGPVYANNFFRVATENKEAVAAYRKVLGGKQLVESPPSRNSFSALAFQLKIREIQKD